MKRMFGSHRRFQSGSSFSRKGAVSAGAATPTRSRVEDVQPRGVESDTHRSPCSACSVPLTRARSSSSPMRRLSSASAPSSSASATPHRRSRGRPAQLATASSTSRCSGRPEHDAVAHPTSMPEIAGSSERAVLRFPAVGRIAVQRKEIHRGAADEAGYEHVGGRLVDLARGADLSDTAGVHDDDAVGERHRLDLVVRDIDRGDAEPRRAAAATPCASGCEAWRRGWRAARRRGTLRACARWHGRSPRAVAGHRRAPPACVRDIRSRPSISATDSRRARFISSRGVFFSFSAMPMFSRTVLCG